MLVGAKFYVCGGVYGSIAPGLRYMFVGTGVGATHVGGAIHYGFATVGVVSMFAICWACCPTVVCRAIISCTMLEIFLFNSLVLALDACVRLAKVLSKVVMLSLSSFYTFAALWYGLPPLCPDCRQTIYASAKWVLNSALFLFSVANA